MEPDNARVHINRGNALRVEGKLDEAITQYVHALELEPDNAAAHINLGNTLRVRGRLDEAVAHYVKALDLDPDNAGAHLNLGNVLQYRGQLEDAAAHYERALAAESDHAAAHINLGNVLQAQGKFGDAVAHYTKALPKNAANAALFYNLGGAILGARGSLSDAAACFAKALSLEPRYVEAHYLLGNIFSAQGKLDDAVASYQRALSLMPERPDIYNELGNALRVQGKLETARECCERALALDPNYAAAHYNLGNVFGDQGKLDAAVGCYERALALIPDYADAHTNLTITLREQGRTADAMACCQRALTFHPDSADANFCDAYLRLLAGDFPEGWRKYEWRWRTKDARPHGFTAPLWDGKDLLGKAILLHCEQGLGDNIQGVRYARLVKDKGGTVLLSSPPSLARLFQGVSGVDRIVTDGSGLHAYDVHAPLMSLPGLFQTTLDTIPSDVPYLHPGAAQVAAWKDRLASYRGFRVGICWRGRPTHPDDRKRSMAAAQFTQFLNVPKLVVVSLQKDATTDELETLSDISGPFFDAGPFLDDFSDTASAMANLDLVITVDTSICHLAGAVAARVWTLIPFAPDWRWLLQREDSPWYPTMRLFRQPKNGDWQSVLERVRGELVLETGIPDR
jgi:tetratricopeptide (TPR) repeat protein